MDLGSLPATDDLGGKRFATSEVPSKSRQRMDCGGLLPLCGAGRGGLRPSCGLRLPRFETGALGARGGGGLLRAAKRWARKGGLFAGAPAAEGRLERAATERTAGQGAVEVACPQYPCRFKRTGNFCSPAGTKSSCVWTLSGTMSAGIDLRGHPTRRPVQKLKCAVSKLGGLSRLSGKWFF